MKGSAHLQMHQARLYFGKNAPSPVFKQCRSLVIVGLGIASVPRGSDLGLVYSANISEPEGANSANRAGRVTALCLLAVADVYFAGMADGTLAN